MCVCVSVCLYMCMCIILGIVGNLWVIAVILSSSTLRSKPINRFIINQSCLDFLASSCIFFRQYLTDLSDGPDLGFLKDAWCRLWLANVVHVFLFGGSGYNLVALSFERHSAIMNPLGYDERKVSRLHEALIGSLNYSLLLII